MSDANDERESAWQAYPAHMLELDAAYNLAGRGLIPSWRDWHAGWDAAQKLIGEADALQKYMRDEPGFLDLLREHDADVWDDGFADGRRQDAEGDDGPRFVNPYREQPKEKWVDPEPWLYPVSGMRTAHKLAYTKAEYRPRTVKPEDEL